MIRQAIIPLAGLGTRLLPLTSVFAKELLPINGKPGIEYILDECIEAGIKEIIFIISKKKQMIKQAIIPLAGLGTRLLPLTSVFAKELLPINGKPGIEYILDECIDAGIKEIIFIRILLRKKKIQE